MGTVHKAQTGGRGNILERTSPLGPLLGVQDTGEGPGEFLPRPRAYKGSRKSYLVQKTGRKSAPMSNETNV